MQYISSLIRKPKRRTPVAQPSTPVAQPSTPSGTAAEAGSSSSSSNKLVFLDNGHTYSFDLEDLLSASAEVLGKGSIGTSYKAILREGTTVVTKRLKEVFVTESEFGIQMEVLGKVRHDNVVPLRAYYISQYEKLLIYDYMAYGTVASHLRGCQTFDMNWENRRKIALSTAKGIAHLHIASKLVHGNIKASNIFLRPGPDIALSDFGLNPFCGYTGTPPNKAAGYCAPEIFETRKVTYQSDVYSFGVLLLELLTGKAPNHASLVAEGKTLPRWVQSVLSVEWSDEVFDAELMRYDHSEIEIVSLLQIALSCVSYVPEQRPNIQEVVQLIEDLNRGETSDVHRHSYDVTPKSTDTRNSSSSVDVVSMNKLVYLGNKTHSYDLEDLLGASNDILGVGSYGVSFKVGLKDGTTVVVKRLKGVVVTKSEFASHMKVLENIKHDNVVPLKAYYFSADEKLLISNYANSASLSSLLHGCRGSGPAPLDWEHRKKISLSTAKGIAHIHTSGKLSHGNIKSSNVLLIPDQDAALSDFGLNAFFGSATPPNQDEGYSAPEIFETQKVTFQSDVYSLGILILELLTGKAPNQASSGEGTINLPTWVRSVGREERASKVFDAKLKRDSNIEQEMVSLLQIAMACVSNVPDQRPEIEEVVCLIENLIVVIGERPMVG